MPIKYLYLLATAAATAAFGAPAAYNLTDDKGVAHCPETFPANHPAEKEATAGPPASPGPDETKPPAIGRQQLREDPHSMQIASHEHGDGRSAEPHGPSLESFAIQQAIPVPGLTGAPPALQRDVLRMLVQVDRAIDSACTRHRIIDTECLEWNWQTSTAMERWTLSRCGKTIRYRVMFEPAARGGTVFSIHLPGDE